MRQYYYLLGLLGRLQLERHLLLGDEVDALVDLAEAAAPDLLGHLPALLDDVARLEEGLAGLVTCHADLGPPLVLLLDTNFPSAGS